MKLLRRQPKAIDDAYPESGSATPSGSRSASRAAGAAGGVAAETPAEAAERRRAYTPAKGRATPKRRDAEPRRPRAAEPPPTTRREAYKRMRKRGGDRRSASGGRLAGERPLPTRDQGAEKALVRDIVDSRRNIGSIFLFVALIVFVAYLSQSAAIRAWAISAWLVIFLLIAVDSFLLAGRIRKAVAARFPESRVRGLGWYGIQRSTMIRKWRLPKPQVKPGDQV